MRKFLRGAIVSAQSVALAAFALTFPAAGQTATVVNGDTIKLAGTTYRLWASTLRKDARHVPMVGQQEARLPM